MKKRDSLNINRPSMDPGTRVIEGPGKSLRSYWNTPNFPDFLTNQSVLTPVVFTYLVMRNGGVINIDWGDGTKELGWNNANWNVGITKNYSAIKSSYHIKITGDIDKISGIQLVNQPHCYGDLSKWIAPAGMTSFDMWNDGFSGDISALIKNLPSTLGILDIRSNDFSGNLTGLVLPDSLYDLQLSNNEFSGDLSDLVFPNIMGHISLDNNHFTGDISDWTFPTICQQGGSLRVNGNAFTGDLSGWRFPAKFTSVKLKDEIVADDNNFIGSITGWTFGDDIFASNGWQMICPYTPFTGDLSRAVIPAGSSAMPITFSGAGLTKMPRGEFRWVSKFDFYNNSCNTAEIDDLLADIDAYFVGGVVPLINCTYKLTGANMKYPTLGVSNVNLLSVIAKYTAAGKTATFLVNNPTLPDFALIDGNSINYDIFELSTITKDAQSPPRVSVWADKLGSGNNISNDAGATHVPQYYVPPTMGIRWNANGHYLKGIFALTQPFEVYLVIMQLSWLANRVIMNGIDSTSAGIYQTALTPKIGGYAGGASGISNQLALNQWGIVRALFNGPNSEFIVNGNDPVLYSAGNYSMDGFILGNSYLLTEMANIYVKEVVIRKGVDTPENRLAIYNYLKAKHSL